MANRNVIVHQYDQICRAISGQVLSVDVPAWQVSPSALIDEAEAVIDDEST